MTTKSKLPVAVCIAATHEQVKAMVERLRAAEIHEVVVMFHYPGDLPMEPVDGLREVLTRPPHVTATTGAAAGSAIGGIAALSGLAVLGAWPIVLVTVPFSMAVGALIGAAAGAAAHRTDHAAHLPSDIGSPIDFGIPQIRLPDYQERLNAKEYLVAVRSADAAALDRARAIFAELGGEEIETFRPGEENAS